MSTPFSVHCTVSCEVNLTCFSTAAVLLQESRDQTVGPKCKMVTGLSVTKPHSPAFGIIVPSGEGYKTLEKGTSISSVLEVSFGKKDDISWMWTTWLCLSSCHLKLGIQAINHVSCHRLAWLYFIFFKYCVSFIVKHYTFFFLIQSIIWEPTTQQLLLIPGELSLPWLWNKLLHKQKR